MEVVVWTADLDLPDETVAELAPLLHEAERDRAARFAFDHLVRRFVVAHAMVRSVLGAGAVVEVGPHGKPFVAGGPRFNLSHSADRAVLAVSSGAEVGIDIEAVRPVERLEALAERIMSPEEHAGFRAAADQPAFFFDVWTRKESVVKARGDGIISDLRALSYEGCTVARLAVGPGYAGALAVVGAGPMEVVVRDWQPLPARWSPGGEGAGSTGQARPEDI
jgi:4'-phosphopantetheinyl transferase